MPKHVPPSDADLFHLESVACDATPGPWEPQVVLDYQTGDSARVVVVEEEDGVRCIVGEREMDETDQRYIAAVHPDEVLRLVREIRRLRRVEERYEALCGVMQHLDEFLERRGLVAQAQRFVEVRAQLERIHPDAFDAPADGAPRRQPAASVA